MTASVQYCAPPLALNAADHGCLGEHEVIVMAARKSDSKSASERTFAEEVSPIYEEEYLGVRTNQSSSTWISSWCAYYRYSSVVFALAVFCALMPRHVDGAPSSSLLIETDLTRDIYRAGGEPQIAVNPNNPKQLAIVVQAFGTSAVPSYSIFFESPEFWRHFSEAVKDPMQSPPWNQGGLPLISNDGGKTWNPSPLPQPIYYEKNGLRYYGSCDPMVAAGPDGTLYASTEVIVILPGKEELKAGVKEEGADVYDMAGGSHVLVYSTDWGETWSAPQLSDQPIDRPWMKVDQSTGKVYVASTGTYDPTTGKHNLEDVGILDRWLVTWEPHLKGKSRPRRIGGPEASLRGGIGDDLAAANGSVATILIVGGLGRLPNLPGIPKDKEPAAMPDSLKNVVPAGIECVQGKLPACLIFQTSSDDGQHWVRHFVPMPGDFEEGSEGGLSSLTLTADPGKPGRYAIGMHIYGKLMTIVTSDSGNTWSKPATIPESAMGKDFKTRLAYSPNGVLTYAWKKERTDLNEPSSSPPPQAEFLEAAFDVYAAVSCDGGLSWPKAIKVNSKPSLQGEGAGDDLTYIAADTRYAHLVWGDRRMADVIKKIAGNVPGPTWHAYYGRIPFTIVGKGERCGR